MYTPHTVTLYNLVTEDRNDYLYCTVLHGVMLQASKGANVRDSGLEGADAATLYIPFGVSAVDGVTGKRKEYVGPQEFFRAADRSGMWTLSYDGNGGTSFFVKGEYATENETVARAQDNCYTITKVDEMDYGSADMQHWEVGGK